MSKPIFAATQAKPGPWLLLLVGLLFIPLFTTLAARQARAADSDEVTYAVSTFADGKARHYALKAPSGIEVRYFLLQAKDGSMRAAFDACDVCWHANKGFGQEGDNMVCKNCGRRFASLQVGQKRGGCNPGPLPVSLQGDTVHLKKADIYEGQHYFDFDKH